MATQPNPDNLWDMIRELERRVQSLETSNRISNTSIPDGGALTVLDTALNPVMRIGTISGNGYGIEKLVGGVWKAIDPVEMPNLPKIARGVVVITPSAANTPTSVYVNFPEALFTATPTVVVAGNTTVPGTTVTGTGYTGASAAGVTVWATRSDTNNTGVSWLAVQT